LPREQQWVYIVDEAAAHRKWLARLLADLGYRVKSFTSPAAFLAESPIVRPCCLLVDVSRSDESGFKLQFHLQQAGAGIPVVFMTADGDIALGVRAMKAGAIDVLTKPLRTGDLVPAVESAYAKSREWQGAHVLQMQARELYARLTPRERQVLVLVLLGRRNKQIADALESQESTVKVHRSRLMRKLEARTLAELLRIGQQLGLVPVAPVARNSPRDADFRTLAMPAANDAAARARGIVRSRQPVLPMA
jgi:FixJ family two-component response regulator